MALGSPRVISEPRGDLPGESEVSFRLPPGRLSAEKTAGTPGDQLK